MKEDSSSTLALYLYTCIKSHFQTETCFGISCDLSRPQKKMEKGIHNSIIGCKKAVVIPEKLVKNCCTSDCSMPSKRLFQETAPKEVEGRGGRGASKGRNVGRIRSKHDVEVALNALAADLEEVRRPLVQKMSTIEQRIENLEKVRPNLS